MKIADAVMCERGFVTHKSRLVGILRGLPDDEIFSNKEMSNMSKVPPSTLVAYASSFPENNFKKGATRWWGTKTAIVAAKEEMCKNENISA